MPELGTKHECGECGAKFYDLGRPDPICPRCGTNQRELARSESQAAKEPARSRKAAEQIEEPDLEEIDEVAIVAAPEDDEDEVAIAEEEEDDDSD
ncbi:MAG TPA: FYDLN acid domain-containing protein [Thermoanaerobaculia bacterium]|nr:FYDLN acid domain-containing protein [Thermoanaerobaculia bacterium]